MILALTRSLFAASLFYSAVALVVAAALPIWDVKSANGAKGFLWETVAEATNLQAPPVSFLTFVSNQRNNLVILITLATVGAGYGCCIYWVMERERRSIERGRPDETSAP
jgi:hypothetical protein